MLTRTTSDLITYTPSAVGGVSTGLDKILGEVYDVKTFGAKGDGVTEDTAAITAALAAVKASGGVLFFPSGTYLTKAQNLAGGLAPWAIAGQNRNTTILKQKDGVGTLLSGYACAVPITISEITVDSQFSVYGAAGNHGISIGNSNFVTVENCIIRNFKNCAVLFYADVENTYHSGRMRNLYCDGLNNASNGLLFAAMNDCVMENCFIRGLSKDPVISSPGYGLQFKNFAKNCRMVNCGVEYATAGFAFGNDSATAGPQGCVVSNIVVRDCLVGFAGSYFADCAFDNVTIDMTSSDTVTYPGEAGLDINTGAVGNSFSNIVIKNVRAARAAARFRTGATDNYVHIGVLNGINTTAVAAQFDAGSQYNSALLSRQINPRIRAGGLHSMGGFQAGVDTTNSFIYGNYATLASLTIAGGVLTIPNRSAETVYVETEGAAASDDLDTITKTAFEGDRIILRTNSNLRDVVVKHNIGNIRLNGAVDMALDTTSDSLVLVYSEKNSFWTEIGRSTVA